MINLNNKNIILTGATGGIGNSILEVLIKAGANVLATGTNDEKLKKIKEKFKSVRTVKFDISMHEKIEDFINESHNTLDNKVDVLINNAGITRDNLSIRMKDEEWHQVINLNLTSTFLLSKLSLFICGFRFLVFLLSSLTSRISNFPSSLFSSFESSDSLMSSR